MTAVTVNIGSPARLNIEEGRIGSRWYLPLVFSEDLHTQLATVTSATSVLRLSTEGEVKFTFTVNITNKATGVFIVSATKAQTAAILPGKYLWEIEFAATDPEIDGWAPLRGSWPVVDRIAGGS